VEQKFLEKGPGYKQAEVFRRFKAKVAEKTMWPRMKPKVRSALGIYAVRDRPIFSECGVVFGKRYFHGDPFMMLANVQCLEWLCV
jgi:hypothetical protein